jgi:hypothetical protein
MEYHIEIEEYDNKGCVHTFVDGLMSETDRNKSALETVQIMRRNNIKKAIWDLRNAELDYSLIGSHLVVLNLSALGVKDDDKIAVIYHQNKEQHEHAKIAAHNRGIINIDYFQNIEDAIKWLI